ncbi:LOB domain-containing protein 41 [Dichanthelium oligosanthes]|uniref:LOB domain-containing protein 41 n=1 Tax=Dichanthelium oligosanthes TaxID=888268 RepID=A0A1E5VG32_9POAL|nr:LOB domain-containing protein 41 [Dichanthelium oligosanthes]
MRMSCNGCRVLRKGCSDACTIRPCLQWIKTPEAQANATVFLAKFYGRAGLLNLLAAAPADSLRPAVFRSLLYEACGRIVNPVYGSVGLLWSGQWQACQAAVEAVLKGHPVVQVDAGSDAAALLGARTPAGASAYDIRHVAKDPDAAAAADLLRVSRGGRTRFKRAASSSTSSKPHHKGKASNNKRASPRAQHQEPGELEPEPMVVEHDDHRAPSHDEESAGSHDHHLQGSEDTDVEAGSHVSQAEAEPQSHAAPVSSQVLAAAQENEEVGLELTLGFEPAKARSARCDLSAASSLLGLRLELPA